MQQLAFSSNEKKITLVLVLTFAVRLVGLFMLLPIFVLRAQEYSQANAQLIGIAAGIYGFPQALLQLPFGYLSDKLGRKRILTIGFILLAIGSVICALASDIYLLILGRALQGAGAIGSVVSASLADYTRPIIRTRAMALLGMAIGASFLIAIALGPALDAVVGIKGLFWLTAISSLISMLVCLIFLPADNPSGEVSPKFLTTLREPRLLILSGSVLALHAILSALFLVLPKFMQQLGLTSFQQSIIYLVTLLSAMLLSYRAVYRADQHVPNFKLDKLSILMIPLALLALYWGKSSTAILSCMLVVFFRSFCILESSMPAMVSKIAPPAQRGLAMGFFSSCQFLGVFVGSMCAGILNQKFGLEAIIYFAMSLAFVWLIMAGYFTEKINKIEELLSGQRHQ